MDHKMTPEEELELETNIANLKAKIASLLDNAIHTALIALILVLSGIVGLNLTNTTLPYVAFGGALISLCIAFRLIYKWDWYKDVLAGVEKSDFKFFTDTE